MRFGMMAAVGLLAAAAGIANGEQESGKPWSVPNFSSDNAPIIMAQLAAKPASSATARAIGICQIVDNTPGWPAGEVRIPNTLEADQAAREYIYSTLHIDLYGMKATVTLLVAPQYGNLIAVDGMANGYEYLPSSATYAGKDSATFLVEVGGYKLKVMYVFHVLTGGVGDRPEDIDAICGPKGIVWRISSSFTTPGFDNAALQALLDATGINNTVVVSTANLSTGTLGQTTGANLGCQAQIDSRLEDS